MDTEHPAIYRQHKQRLHGSQPCTTDQISSESPFQFGLFVFFCPLLTVLHLQAQPWHPTICILDHAVGVSPAASGLQSSCNPQRLMRQGGIEISDLGHCFPWTHEVSEKHHSFVVKHRDWATPGPALNSFSHAS